MSNTKDPKQNPEQERTLSPETETLMDAEQEFSTFTFFDEAQNTKQKKEKKGGLSNGAKAVIGSVGVVAVLGGTLAVLKLTEEKPPVEQSSAVENPNVVALWSVEDEDISAISVEQPNGEDFSVHRVIEKQESVDSMTGQTVVDEVENYYLDGYDDLPTSTVDIRTLATRVATLESVDIIQKDTPESDLAKYGLDEPIRVVLTVDDADDICFLLGDISPSASYSYLCVEGDNTVYTVSSSSVSQYRVDWKDYLSTNVTEEQADDDESYIEDIRIERADLDYDFYFVYDEFYVENSSGGSSAVHVMQEPIKCLLSADKAAAATHGIYAMTASRVEYPHPTEQQLTDCGLTGEDFAVRVVSNISDGRRVEFRLGKTYEVETTNDAGETVTETYYYGYLDSVDCIYGFAADDIVYENLKPEDVTSKIIVDTYVWDIGRLVYTAGDLKLDFEGIGTSKEDYVVTCNGQEVATERFRLLYTYLLKTAAEDLVLEDVTVSGTPMASILLERQDGKRTTNVAFYEADGMRAYIVVDGEVRFMCRKAYVNTLISNMEIFHTDAEFTMTW
ncbi:MAG: DUF4340 domain-containing protein [Ruminococcus sp.]|nr:DUF4340 domain-containing protein [Ruminococcus sp.]